MPRTESRIVADKRIRATEINPDEIEIEGKIETEDWLSWRIFNADTL